MAKESKAGGIFLDFRLGLANLQKNTKEATRALKALEKDISGIGKNITRAFQVASTVGGVLAVKQLTLAIRDLAREGDRASGIEANFKKLGGASSQIDKASKAALGLVSSFDLMAIANKGLIANVSGFGENFTKLTDLSTRLSESLGTDVKGKLEEVTQAFVTGKEKSLEALGFNIQADKAYKEFAKTNGLVADKLDVTQKKLAIQAQAFKQIDEVISGLEEPTKGAGDAFDSFARAVGDAYTKVGQGIDGNKNLAKTLERLEINLSDVDWVSFGNQIANVAAFIADVVDGLYQLAKITKFLIDNLPTGGGAYFNNPLLEQAKEQQKLQGKVVGAGVGAKIGMPSGFGTNKPLDDETKAQKKLQDEIKKSVEEFKNLEQEVISSTLEKGLNDAIQFQNAESFNSLADQLYDRVYDSTFKGLQAGIASGEVSLIEAQSLAAIKAGQAVGVYRDDFADVAADNAAEIVKRHEEAYELSISNWELLFDQAINGVSVSLEDMLKQAAVGFAAEMANALVGSISGIDLSNPKALGSSLAKSILGDLVSVGSASLGGGTTGIGPVIDGAEYAGALAGESMIGTLTAAAPAVGAALGAAAVASFGASVFSDPKQPYEKYGRDSNVNTAGRVQAAISSGGLSELGIAGLSGGSMNAETNARKSFEGALEDLIKEIGGLKLFNSKGGTDRLTDIKIGSSDRFDDPNWPEQFKQYGQDATQVFDALGKGMTSLLGITEDVGGQVGLILAENLNGSIDNARLAVQQLGLSFEDFQKYFLEQAEKGTIRWSEYNAQIAAVGEAFKPGLVGLNATKQAFDNLISSGGRGMAAVKSVKDAAVEGLEAGLETISQLGDRLLTEGANPELVKALVDSAAERGIKGLKEMSQLTNEQAGSIAGGMEALSKTLAQTWEDMGKQIDTLNAKLESLPEIVETTVRVNYEIDPKIEALLNNPSLSLDGGSVNSNGVEQFASGGIVSRATHFMNNGKLAVAGESGLEAIMPLTRVNGKLGVKSLGGQSSQSQIVINVDARGAQVGVERQVVSAIERMKGEIQGLAVEAVTNHWRRGGR